MNKHNILGSTLSRLLETYPNHSILARIEAWIEEGKDPGSLPDCFVMARELAAGAVPYPTVTRLTTPIIATLNRHGFGQFRRVVECGIDPLGENARWRLSEAGSTLTGSGAHYRLLDDEGPNLSGTLYSAQPDTNLADFAAWKDVVFFPEAAAEITLLGKVQFFRKPSQIRKPMAGMRILTRWIDKPPWDDT